MRFGGNTRAKEALVAVVEETDLKSKYESFEAESYRMKLKTEVHKELGLALEEIPVRQAQPQYTTATNDPRFSGARSISSNQFYDPNGRGNRRPNGDESGICPCTIL
jgi:hypothetical protein